MAPRKKTPPPEKENIAPGVSRVTVGNWITRRSEIRMDRNITNEELMKYLLGNPLPEKFGSFDGYIAEYERGAKKTLEDARLPAEPGRFYTMSGGELLSIPTIEEGATDIYTRAGGLLEFVASRDFRERESPEWYAAAILHSVLNIRLAIRRGDADITAGCAVELGILITEAKARGFFIQAGAMGPANRENKKSPYPILARRLFLNYPDETDEHRFKMIPTNNELQLGRYKFYRNAKRIYAEQRAGRQDSGEWKSVGKPLGIAGFRSHMTEARKRISR